MSFRHVNVTNLRINTARLLSRLEALARIGAIDGGGVCRLALTDEDRAGRDQVVAWMRELGMSVRIDAIGNVVAVREGLEDGPPGDDRLAHRYRGHRWAL